MAVPPKEAWRKATNCALLAEQVADEPTRNALITLRNSWINIANNSEVWARWMRTLFWKYR